MVFETKNAKFVSFQKMVDKKNLFEGRATTQTKNGFFFLKRHFLFVSWPSLQIPFLLGKVLEKFRKTVEKVPKTFLFEGTG